MSSHNKVTLKRGEYVQIHLLRRNGALVDVFTDEDQAIERMKRERKNGEFWRIASSATVPHKVLPDV